MRQREVKTASLARPFRAPPWCAERAPATGQQLQHSLNSEAARLSSIRVCAVWCVWRGVCALSGPSCLGPLNSSPPPSSHGQQRTARRGLGSAIRGGEGEVRDGTTTTTATTCRDGTRSRQLPPWPSMAASRQGNPAAYSEGLWVGAGSLGARGLRKHLPPSSLFSSLLSAFLLLLGASLVFPIHIFCLLPSPVWPSDTTV